MNAKNRVYRAGLLVKLLVITPPVLYVSWVLFKLTVASHVGVLEINLSDHFHVKFRLSASAKTPRILRALNIFEGERKEEDRNKTEVNRRAEISLANTMILL